MTQYCDTCSMILQNEREFQNHCAGKKHLKKARQMEMLEKSIVISPLPKFVQREVLISFVRSFGRTRLFEFGPNHVTVHFRDRITVDTLLSGPKFLGKIKLNIKRGTQSGIQNKGNQNTVDESPTSISYNNIRDLLIKETTFDGQLTAFLNAVRLTDSDNLTKHVSACIHIERIFKAIFPNCKTYQFGSTLSGLGFKDSDLDIYMNIGEPVQQETEGIIRLPQYGWTMNKILKEAKNLMYSNVYVFSNIIAISKAKIPIIKFYHIPTNIFCDISFKNSLGIHKSYLIQYCLSLDTRLKPLMMLIKYWAKHFNFSTRGRMSNYGLALLVIFYLQQPSVNIVPPLIEFKNACKPETINGWDVNFCKNDVQPSVANTSTIPQLLRGFFSFYASFDFKSHVICPVDGKAHAKSEFDDIDSLPACMDRYKEFIKEDETLNRFNTNRPVCLQDPVELNNNITAPLSILDAFVKCCAVSANVCGTNSENNYANLIDRLFTAIPTSAGETFTLMIHAKRAYRQLHTFVPDRTRSMKGQWYDIICNLVIDIFKKVFKLQVEVLSANPESKQQKLEQQSDVHTENHTEMTLCCIGSDCCLRNRKPINHIHGNSFNILEKESIISEQTIQNFIKEGGVNNDNLDFRCKLILKAGPRLVILKITDQNSENDAFRNFQKFTKCNLIQIVQQMLM